MNPAIVKQKLWRLSLKMNPQAATYYARTITTTPSPTGSDALTPYSLNRVTYQELTTELQLAAGFALDDIVRVYTIYQADLDNCNGPVPQPGYELSFTDGTVWTMKRVVATPMIGTAYACTCQRTR